MSKIYKLCLSLFSKSDKISLVRTNSVLVFWIQFKKMWVPALAVPAWTDFTFFRIRNRKFAGILNSSFGTERNDMKWQRELSYGMGQNENVNHISWWRVDGWTDCLLDSQIIELLARTKSVYTNNKQIDFGSIEFPTYYIISSCATSFHYFTYKFWGFSKLSNLFDLNCFQEWPLFTRFSSL